MPRRRLVSVALPDHDEVNRTLDAAMPGFKTVAPARAKRRRRVDAVSPDLHVIQAKYAPGTVVAPPIDGPVEHHRKMVVVTRESEPSHAKVAVVSGLSGRVVTIQG